MRPAYQCDYIAVHAPAMTFSDVLASDPFQDSITVRTSSILACVCKALSERRQRHFFKKPVPTELDKQYGLLSVDAKLPEDTPPYLQDSDLLLFSGAHTVFEAEEAAIAPMEVRSPSVFVSGVTTAAKVFCHPALSLVQVGDFSSRIREVFGDTLGLMDGCGVVLAGGSVGKWARGLDNGSSDIDVFLLGHSAQAVYPHVQALLQRFPDIMWMRGSRSLKVDTNLGRLDIVLQVYPTALELLMDFDIDASRFLYLGDGRYRTTYTGICSMRSHTVLLSYPDILQLLGHSSTNRVLKYVSRGFQLALRGFPDSVQKHLQQCRAMHPDQLRIDWSVSPTILTILQHVEPSLLTIIQQAALFEKQQRLDTIRPYDDNGYSSYSFLNLNPEAAYIEELVQTSNAPSFAEWFKQQVVHTQRPEPPNVVKQKWML
jgi:hypothetical protein